MNALQSQRKVCLGYRVSEVKLDPLPKFGKGCSIRFSEYLAPSFKRPVLTSLGPHLEGVALPHPDPYDAVSVAAGGRKRFLREMPLYMDGSAITRQIFRKMVVDWLEHNVRPLAADGDYTILSWLRHGSYPLWRQIELETKYDEITTGDDPMYELVNSFMKWEAYLNMKYPRGINSRSDEFKVMLGPFIHQIEKVVFDSKWFIKYVPVDQRPTVILERFDKPGLDILSCDFTSMEAHYQPELMSDILEQLLNHVMHPLTAWVDRVYSNESPGNKAFRVAVGRQVCRFKHFVSKSIGRLMSGELWTSLLNGITNLLVTTFVSEFHGCHLIDAVVEGDDGLFLFSGKVPNSDQFLKLGFLAKPILAHDIEDTDFCSLIFDRDSKLVIRDPRKVLATFGWGDPKLLNARSSRFRLMLRCKALSCLAQYPGCPVLQSLSTYVLRCTSGVDIRGFVLRSGLVSKWQRETFIQLGLLEYKVVLSKVKPVPTSARLLMERRFGFTLEMQRKYENYFDSLDDIKPVPLWFIPEPDWILYWDYFTQTYRRGSDDKFALINRQTDLLESVVSRQS